jgi:hypothetical protein
MAWYLVKHRDSLTFTFTAKKTNLMLLLSTKYKLHTENRVSMFKSWNKIVFHAAFLATLSFNARHKFQTSPKICIQTEMLDNHHCAHLRDVIAHE